MQKSKKIKMKNCWEINWKKKGIAGLNRRPKQVRSYLGQLVDTLFQFFLTKHAKNTWIFTFKEPEIIFCHSPTFSAQQWQKLKGSPSGRSSREVGVGMGRDVCVCPTVLDIYTRVLGCFGHSHKSTIQVLACFGHLHKSTWVFWTFTQEHNPGTCVFWTSKAERF